MIKFPSKTEIKTRGKLGQFLSKKELYSHCSFNAKEEDQVVAEIERIAITHSFKTETLSLSDGKMIHEILLFEVALKKRAYHAKIFEKIARSIPKPILFLLRYEGKIQLALYEQNWHHTEWIEEEAAELDLKGPTLDDLWRGFVVQIAALETVSGETLEEKLELKKRINQLEKKIDQLEKQIALERQPGRKFDLHKERQRLIRQLEEMKNQRG